MSSFTPIENTKAKFTKRDLFIACGILGSFLYFVYRSRRKTQIEPEQEESFIEEDVIEEEDEENEEDHEIFDGSELEKVMEGDESEIYSRDKSQIKRKNEYLPGAIADAQKHEAPSAKNLKPSKNAHQREKEYKKSRGKGAGKENRNDDLELKEMVNLFRKKNNLIPSDILLEENTEDYFTQIPLDTNPSTLPSERKRKKANAKSETKETGSLIFDKHAKSEEGFENYLKKNHNGSLQIGESQMTAEKKNTSSKKHNRFYSHATKSENLENSGNSGNYKNLEQIKEIKKKKGGKSDPEFTESSKGSRKEMILGLNFSSAEGPHAGDATRRTNGLIETSNDHFLPPRSEKNISLPTEKPLKINTIFDKSSSGIRENFLSQEIQDIHSPETRKILQRFEEYASRLFENPCNSKRDSIVKREEARFRRKILADISVNCFLDTDEFCEMKGSIAISFFIDNPNFEEELFVDYSGKTIVSILINERKVEVKTAWRENKIYMSNTYLKEGQNSVKIFFENCNIFPISYPTTNHETNKIFFKHPEKALSSVIPCFDQPGLYFDFLCQILLPKNHHCITSDKEKVNQPITENFKQKLFDMNVNILSEDVLDKRLFVFKMFCEPSSLGLAYGPLEEKYKRGEIKIFTPKRRIIRAKMNADEEYLLEILVTALKFLKISLKGLTPGNPQKIDVILIDDLNPKIFSFTGGLVISTSLLNSERRADLIWLTTCELARQFFQGSYSWFNNLWFYEGISMHAAFSFVRTLERTLEPLIYNNLKTLILYGKVMSIIQELSRRVHPLYLKIENSQQGKLYRDEISHFKSLYFFKQFNDYLHPLHVSDVLANLKHPFKKKEFLTLVREVLSEKAHTKEKSFLKWFEDWVEIPGINEVEVSLNYIHEGESVILQRDSFQYQHDNLALRTHYTDALILNKTGSTIGGVKLIISDSVTHIFESDNKNFKDVAAIIIDLEDRAYFRFRIDLETIYLLADYINVFELPRTRLNIYSIFYLEMLSGTWGPKDYLDAVLNSLEREESGVVLRIVLKNCYLLMRSCFNESLELDYAQAFLRILITKVKQTHVSNLRILFKYMWKMACLPEQLQFLEDLYKQKQPELERIYKEISLRDRLKLLVRICSSENLNPEAKKVYEEEYLDSCNPFLREIADLCLQAGSSNPRDKLRIWNHFVENHDDKEFLVLKQAMKCFNQQGQREQLELYKEKYFESLPLVLNIQDEYYSYSFARYLFPSQYYDEELADRISEILIRLDNHTEMKIVNYLNSMMEMGNRILDSMRRNLFKKKEREQISPQKFLDELDLENEEDLEK